MNLWIIITVAAAFLQNIRSSLQKHLKNVMGSTGATFVRFGFGVPFAFLYWYILIYGFGFQLPDLTFKFFLWATIASFAQIFATFLLVYLFSFRNFTVGTAYSRTEPAQTAIFALILFGEKLSFGSILAICISIIGVMMISVARSAITLKTVFTSVLSRTALIGLASGTLFGLSAVSYREASLSIDHEFFMVQSSTTLLYAITLQTLMMLLWMSIFQRDELPKILKAWKPALAVGFAGATASFGWFTAFTLQQAALVKVVAQIEMIFTFATSVFFFKEAINRLEVIGCIFITAGIILLVLI
jgi:drug/metabolite transporter (DMT)-like permease